MPDAAGHPQVAAAPDAEADLHARLLARLRAPAEPGARAAGGAAGRASGGASGGAPIADRPPLGRLSGLLDEIDATVMARSLVLRDAAGVRMRLDVCNRRLIRATRAPGPGPEAPAPEPPGGPPNLTYAGAEALDDLRRDLERVLANPEVGLDWGPPAGGVGLEQSGVSVATLRGAWGALSDAGAASGTRPDLDRIDDLCAAVVPWLVAGLRLDGTGPSVLAGSEAAVAALHALAAHGTASAPPQSPALTITARGAADALLLVAAAGPARALLVVAPAGRAAARAAWEARH